MVQLISLSFILQVIGIFTSVSVLGLSQIIMVIPAVYITHEVIVKKTVKLPRSAWFLLGLIVIALTSLMVNQSVLVNPLKNYGRIKYLLSGILSIFIFRFYLDRASEKAKATIINVGILCIAVVGIVCLYQSFYLGQERARTLTDTLRYGYGIGMILPLLIGISLRPNILQMINRKLLIGSIILGFISLYLTLTRGAMLGFICALPFALIYWNRKKGFIAFAVGGCIVLFLGGFYLFGTGQMGNRFISSKDNQSDNTRFTQWEAAYKGWSEKPILGIGYSDFINQEQAIKARHQIDQQHYKGHAHNIFLEFLVGTGLIGFLAFLGWIVFWAYEMYKSSSTIAGFFIPFGVALLVSGQFEVVLDANNASMIFMIYGLSMVLKEKSLER